MAQTRLNVNINEATVSVLRREAAIVDTSITEIVRRATSVYDYVATAQRDGGQLQVVRPNGDIVELRLL